QSLHVLMGFSLLGILLVNLISIHSPSSYYNPYEWWQYGDLSIYAWLDVLVQGSFYPIIAMIFGYSMVMMMEDMTTKGLPFYKISIKNLTVLLIIGSIHAFLIWYGDILIIYALLGFLLLFFLRLPGRILMGIGVGLYLLPQLIISIFILLMNLIDTVSLRDFTNLAGLQQSAEVYA